jgi:hypothetical protein
MKKYRTNREIKWRESVIPTGTIHSQTTWEQLLNFDYFRTIKVLDEFDYVANDLLVLIDEGLVGNPLVRQYAKQNKISVRESHWVIENFKRTKIFKNSDELLSEF